MTAEGRHRREAVEGTKRRKNNNSRITRDRNIKDRALRTPRQGKHDHADKTVMLAIRMQHRYQRIHEDIPVLYS